MFWNKKNPKEQKRKTIRLPAGLPRNLLPIGHEALRIHESVEFSAQTQFEQAKIWRTFNYWLGAPAAVTAALAGSAIFGSDVINIAGVPGNIIGGTLALVSAALTAILTTVNASRRMTQSQSSGNAYLQLQTEARQLVTIDLQHFKYDEARAALDSITNSRNELNKTADVPGRRAYKIVKKNLKRDGGQDYAVDQES